MGLCQPCWVEVAAGGQWTARLEGLRGVWNFPHPAHSPSSGVRCAKVGGTSLPKLSVSHVPPNSLGPRQPWQHCPSHWALEPPFVRDPPAGWGLGLEAEAQAGVDPGDHTALAGHAFSLLTPWPRQTSENCLLAVLKPPSQFPRAARQATTNWVLKQRKCLSHGSGIQAPAGSCSLRRLWEHPPCTFQLPISASVSTCFPFCL